MTARIKLPDGFVDKHDFCTKMRDSPSWAYMREDGSPITLTQMKIDKGYLYCSFSSPIPIKDDNYTRQNFEDALKPYEAFHKNETTES